MVGEGDEIGGEVTQPILDPPHTCMGVLSLGHTNVRYQCAICARPMPELGNDKPIDAL